MPSPPAPHAPWTTRLEAWLNVSTSGLPSVSFDGDHVLFISDRSGMPQPYAVASSGGDVRRLHDSSERVAAVFASPTRAHAVLAIDAGGNEHWQLSLVPFVAERSDPVDSVRALTADPTVIHSPGTWSEDGRQFYFTSNSRDRRFFDAYSVGVDAQEPPRRIFEGDGWHHVASARGNRVAVVRSNAPLDSDLFLVDGDRTVHLSPHSGEAVVFDASVGRDAVYGSTNAGREFAGLARYRTGGSGPEFLKEFPGDVETVQVAPDGESVGFTVNRDGFSELHVLSLTTLEDRNLPMSPRGVITSLRWFPDSSAVAYDVSSPMAVEVYRRVTETGKARKLTSTPIAPPSRTPEPALRTCSAEDGLKIAYWEYAPAARSPRGTIVQVHGGPESQSRPRFDPLVGFWVESGWRVVQPNVRGSLGYGRTFVHLDDVRHRMDAVRDLRDVMRSLAREGKAPPGRTAVVGASYGGFMVLSVLATYPDLFAAGVDIVGISNLVTFLERTGSWRRRHREVEYGSLERDREFLTAISPLHHADQIRVPLLVLHGRNDPRVPAGEAEQIVETLRAHGRPVDLLIFEDEGHGILRRSNRIIAFSRAAEFLERHLTGPTEPSPSPPADG